MQILYFTSKYAWHDHGPAGSICGEIKTSRERDTTICLNTCSLVCLLSLRCVSCRKRKDMQEVDFQENCHCTVQERAHSFNQQWIIKEGEERQSAIVFDNVQRSV